MDERWWIHARQFFHGVSFREMGGERCQKQTRGVQEGRDRLLDAGRHAEENEERSLGEGGKEEEEEGEGNRGS